MPSIAPLVAAWKRRARNLPGPLAGTGEVSNGEPVQVEMLVSGVWVDITSYAMVRDDSGSISVSGGITGGEGSQTERGQARLVLKNQDGRFSPRNPSGPYYGAIGRNTPIRISVPDGLGGKSYRIWGEATAWEPNWDPTGTDVWVDVTVEGLLKRLAQAPAPERSVIYEAITDPPLTGLVAYWPMEDPAGATELASALTNGSPMTWTGTPTLAAYDGFGASDPLPTITGAALTGGVTKYDTTSVTQYQARWLLAVPAAGFSDVDVIARLKVQEVAAGASLLNYFDIHYNDPPGGLGSYGGPGTLTITAKDGDEATIGSNASTTIDARGRLLRVSVEISLSGADITGTLRILDINTGVTDSASMTVVSTSMSRVLSVSLGPSTLGGSAGVVGAAVGHLLLQTTITDIDDLGRAIQPSGETAGRRIQRLCGEEGIPFEWIGDLDDTAALGAQGRQNLLALVQEAVQADGGLLYETTDVLGLGYRTRASLYNQDPALTLSYTGYQFAEIPVPVEDDRYTQNRVTVTVGGVSATYEETDGRLSTEQPPAGVGVYGSDVTLNLATTDRATLLDQAAWRVHLGTVDEARYPTVTVNLAHPSITPELKRAILGLRMGDRARFTGMPAWLPPDDPDQLVLGTEETISHFQHKLTFTCAPASPYSYVGVLDATAARIDVDSQLVSAVSSSATSLVVAPAAGETDLWTTDSAEVPWDVRAGGEVMRVTSVTPWLSDTFTRTASSSWGTSDTGQTWSNSGGTSADYAVSGGVGTHTLASVNVSRRCFIDTTILDWDLYCDVAVSATATGGSIWGGPTGRHIDSDNLYQARLEFDTSSVVTLAIRKRSNAVETSLGTYVLPGTYTAGVFYRVRFQARGAVLRAKAWLVTDVVETPEWQVTVTDGTHSTTNYFGARSIASSANTNVSPQVSYDNYQVTNPQTFTVTRSINGVSKAQVAGEYLSLANPTILSL
ncbi:hypothetical protein ACH4ZX_03945 [Streptomyces sp. NPDC020490]|uniref:hypothetical protein n=1 Tax=Streptomyces sp. NPDC020490 TaxID=3365078 RepID=UPI0037B56117